MFCLGVIICIAGLCRVWYISIYIESWDFLCTYCPAHSIHFDVYVDHLLTNTPPTGHGTVLFVIISIETSIGIVCGCLPGCKPLFTKLFPSIFARSTNSNSRSGKTPQYPPSKSADGQPFPFQIVKEEGFEVRYGDDNEGKWGRGTSSKMGTSSTSKAGMSRSRSTEDDGASEDSREWIMMQKNPGMSVGPASPV
jgi:hypothetical protein